MEGKQQGDCETLDSFLNFIFQPAYIERNLMTIRERILKYIRNSGRRFHLEWLLLERLITIIETRNQQNKTAYILKTFYDMDIIDECVFSKWEKTIQNDQGRFENAKRFLNWLNSVSESDSD